MTLTEQWKKGELESGWYYVNFYSVGAVMQEYLPEHNGFGYDEKNLIQEVLAPVPSYEEWKTVFNCANKYEVEYVECVNDYEELKKENQQLKELLETASTWIREPILKREIVMLQTLKRRINEALGEKK